MADFAGVPRAMVVDRALSPAARITAEWMLCFADKHGAAYVSLNTIALLMEVEPRQVQKKVKEMIDRGHLVKRGVTRNEDGERVRGFQFIFKKTSMKDVIAERKASLKDGLPNPKSVLPAQQKRPSSAAKASSEDITSMNTVVNTVVNTRETRGTRFPPDAILVDEWREFASKERPDLDPDRVFANFKDHWISAPRTKGLKLDWAATWRVWVRRERNGQHRSGKAQAAGNGFAQLVIDGFGRSGSDDELEAAGFNPGGNVGRSD
jgi:hypothetical protein